MGDVKPVDRELKFQEKAILAFVACQPNGFSSEADMDAFCQWAEDISIGHELLKMLVSGEICCAIQDGEPAWWLSEKGRTAAERLPKSRSKKGF